MGSPNPPLLLPWGDGKLDIAVAFRDSAICPLRMPTALAQVAPGHAACATLGCPHCRRPLSLDLGLECAAVHGWRKSDLAASSVLAATTASLATEAGPEVSACTASLSVPGGGAVTDRQVCRTRGFFACARRSRRGQVQKAAGTHTTSE